MSNAKQAFKTALTDVRSLLDFHEAVGGTGPGKRPYNLTALNKSGIVLLCATWELYIESIIIECVSEHLKSITKPSDLRKSLSALILPFVQKEKDERSWHQLAGGGWKNVITIAVAERVKALNTPKVGPISGHFHSILGIKDITDSWYWQNTTSQVAMKRLDDFVTLRGSIAHGEPRAANLNKKAVTSALFLITQLVDRTDDHLSREGFF